METYFWCMLLLYFIVILLTLFVVLCVVLMKTTSPYPVVTRAELEKSFLNVNEGVRIALPSIDEPFSVLLSVIVPAFDEEVRLPPMLDECFEFLETRRKESRQFTYEVIIVSDGSRDKTVQVGHQYTRKYGANLCRVLDLSTNRGKGGAVRLGMQSARGAVLLFADADGATKFSDLTKLEGSLKELLKVDLKFVKYLEKQGVTSSETSVTGFGRKDCDSGISQGPLAGDYQKETERVSNALAIVCGSRAHLEEEAIATRSMFRTILMHGFHSLVWILAVRSVRDTQCGFKLLTREAARVCFSSLHVERWAFDVELLYIAEKLKIPVSEVSVNWTEIDGSKVVPVWSWLQMGRDLFLIWMRYLIGAWKLQKHK